MRDLRPHVLMIQVVYRIRVVDRGRAHCDLNIQLIGGN